MIRVENLRKSFGPVHALVDVGFSVGKGEIFGLLGPNGAGKTTTISILATLMAADGGRAEICGLDVEREPEAVRRRIGVVPQELALYEELSARDNLMFWGRLQGLSGRPLRARVEELLAVSELAGHAGRAVRTCSGGMKRRLNILIGLIHAPEVLFLDEPTVGIDAQSRARILEMIGGMNDDGLTVLYTTHYLEEAEQLCDRIGVIDDGRLVALGDKEDLIRQIGDTDHVRFQLDAELEDELRSAAEGWPDVLRITRRRARVELETADGAELLPRLQEFVAERGAALDRLEIIRPNLESLYLKVTGRALRE